MPFKYVQPEEGLQGLDYSLPQQKQEEQQSIDPSTAMSIGKQFMGGGGAAAGEGVALGGSQGPTAGMAGGNVGLASAGGGGGGSGAGGGSAMAGAGPWAALAAIIIGNETYARRHGDRPESKTQHTQDIFSGEVLGQDIEKRWLPELGIKEGSKESKWASHLIHPVSADIGESWESFKDLF